MAIRDTVNVLIPPKAPNLPAATMEYSRPFQDQLLNILRLYFNQIDNFTQYYAAAIAGTTAERPGNSLSIGQMYFDTTLNIPIWWNGKHWVNSAGTTV